MSIDLLQLEKAIEDFQEDNNGGVISNAEEILLLAAKAYLEEHKKAQELVDWSEDINTKEKLDQAFPTVDATTSPEIESKYTSKHLLEAFELGKKDTFDKNDLLEAYNAGLNRDSYFGWIRFNAWYEEKYKKPFKDE